MAFVLAYIAIKLVKTEVIIITTIDTFLPELLPTSLSITKTIVIRNYLFIINKLINLLRHLLNFKTVIIVKAMS